MPLLLLLTGGRKYIEIKQESPLPLTDPRDVVAQRMRNIPYGNTVIIRIFYSP